MSWKSPSYNDRDWSLEHPRTAPRWWVRSRVEFPAPVEPAEPLVLRLYALGSSEIYWDGELIGRNGILGGEGTEVAGRHVTDVPIPPDARQAGEHLVAVRISSRLAVRRPGFFGLLIGDFRAADMRQRTTTAVAVLLVGVLLVVGLFFVVWSKTVFRDQATTLLGTLALVVALLISVEYLRFVWPYPYPWHLPRLMVVSLLTLLVSFLLPAFLWRLLGLPWRRPGLWILGLILVLVPIVDSHFDRQCLWLMRLSIVLSVGLVVVGIRRGAPGRWWAVSGVVLCSLAAPFSGLRFTDQYFFLGFVGMALVFMAQAIGRIRATELARRRAEKQAATLQYDLLRNSIQPHYLMNVLAVAEAWFEEEPQRGREVLASLSRQLESFFAISERSLVPIGEELELCRRYLDTMSHLLELEVEWVVDGVPDDLTVPPGVLLTLVENAVRHGERTNPFRVSVQGIEPQRPGVLAVRNRALDGRGRRGTGRGLEMARALLRESLGPSAQLRAAQEGEDWVVQLDLSTEPGLGRE